jgi:hypothetical protein
MKNDCAATERSFSANFQSVTSLFMDFLERQGDYLARCAEMGNNSALELVEMVDLFSRLAVVGATAHKEGDTAKAYECLEVMERGYEKIQRVFTSRVAAN